MTEATREAVDEESLSTAYYDIAQLLESAEDSEARVIATRWRAAASHTVTATTWTAHDWT